MRRLWFSLNHQEATDREWNAIVQHGGQESDCGVSLQLFAHPFSWGEAPAIRPGASPVTRY